MSAGDTTLSAARLRLRFVRGGDRYRHEILWTDAAGNEHLLLATVEGDDTSAWPPSPPLQDFHQEQRPGGATVGLAVGMAGRSHWSLAVEALPDGQLRFDVACRANESPGPLGTRYRLGEGVAAQISAGTVTLSVQSKVAAALVAATATAAVQVPAAVEGPHALDTLQVSDAPRASEAAAADNTAGAASELAIVAQPTSEAPPCTVRWQYAVRAVD